MSCYYRADDTDYNVDEFFVFSRFLLRLAWLFNKIMT